MRSTGICVAAGMALLMGPVGTAWAGPGAPTTSPMHFGVDHGGGDGGEDHGGEGHGHGDDDAGDDAHAESPEDEKISQGNFFPVGEAAPSAFGYAKIARSKDGTDGRIHVGGLRPGAHYESHLHEGTCSEHGPHYRHDDDGPAGPPNEMWFSSDESDPRAGMSANDHGVVDGTAEVDWKAGSEARSVMLHEGESGDVVACADLS